MALRVGMAGYGLAGRFFHAPLLKGCGLELVAVLTTSIGGKSTLAYQRPLQDRVVRGVAAVRQTTQAGSEPDSQSPSKPQAIDEKPSRHKD